MELSQNALIKVGKSSDEGLLCLNRNEPRFLIKAKYTEKVKILKLITCSEVNSVKCENWVISRA